MNRLTDWDKVLIVFATVLVMLDAVALMVLHSTLG
jgi:hypothetical protein